jgi:PD-(D/E)XK nuclease superfamily
MKISVKQVKMFLECPRRWVAHYLHRVPQLQGPALVEGNALHSQLAALVAGTPPPYDRESRYGKLGQAMIEHLPLSQWGPPLAEVEWVIPGPDCEIDLRCDVVAERGYFLDWKSTGAQRPTQKLPGGEQYWTLQTLEHDLQARIYAWGLMLRWGCPTIRARWVYGSKRFDPGQTPRTWVVDHTFQRAETTTWVETNVFPVIEAIRAHRAAFAASAFQCRDVPHRPEACDWTGRWCDAAGQCGLTSSPIGTYADLHLPVIPTKG